MFIKYQHIERFGTTETEGIENGTCYVFPKIDGTNASIWFKDGVIQCGSRNRHLTLDKDNANFLKTMIEDPLLQIFFEHNPNLRLYGEWLVPHSLKTYKENAWRNFYIFDVMEGDKLTPYDVYKPLMDDFSLDYIPPIRIIKNGNYETFVKCLEENKYLIEDGKGSGEGIVIKNYDYYNKYHRQTWAKIVTSEFKEKHHKEMGAPISEGVTLAEDRIIEEFCTKALIEKTRSKIEVENDGWSSKFIPRLLQTVYYDLVTEECWNFVKKLKNPTINFRTLSYKVNVKIKETLPELF